MIATTKGKGEVTFEHNHATATWNIHPRITHKIPCEHASLL